ncbi:trypsin beta-like [Teleopsis dalmanni]|uniref:trypsin beta-like n=1 Tax=Teleopsis dalmanni TaxID=139649 RepID=UPI0018CEF38F|nr:trypsin beta-like [Teleopsis dalmanni]
MNEIVIRSLVLAIIGIFGTINAAAVPNTPNGRIVGGEQTTIAKYPYQASVRLDTYIMLHICGASIYAPRVVVTAAHCIKGRFASYIYVVAGSSSIVDESEQGIRASKLIYHSGYNKNTHDNDLIAMPTILSELGVI